MQYSHHIKDPHHLSNIFEKLSGLKRVTFFFSFLPHILFLNISNFRAYNNYFLQIKAGDTSLDVSCRLKATTGIMKNNMLCNTWDMKDWKANLPQELFFLQRDFQYTFVKFWSNIYIPVVQAGFFVWECISLKREVLGAKGRKWLFLHLYDFYTLCMGCTSS